MARIDCWNLFLQQAAWHRVAALLWQRLSPLRAHLPEAVAEKLNHDSRITRMLGVRHAAELRRLCTHLQKQRLPFLVLKGAPLSLRLYGDAGTRFAKDIDILVPEADVDKVHALLLALGYRRTIPHALLSASVMQYYGQFRKDFVYRHQISNIELELHWRLAQNPCLLSMDAFQPFQHCQACRLADVDVPVLCDAHNALYLCMHAGNSNWKRMSWLCDIAALLWRPLDWHRVLALAQHHGVLVPVWTSCQAAHRLLAAPLPSALAGYEAPKPAGWALKAALTTLEKARPPNSIVCHIRPLLLCQKPDFLWSHVSHSMAMSLNDIAMLPLPKRWAFLYVLLRPFLWTWRRTLSTYVDHVGLQSAHGAR